MTHIVTLIEGDGIGPEVSRATCQLLDALKVDIKWDIQLAGEAALKALKNPLPPETVQSIKKNKLALKGPTTTPVGAGFRSVNVTLRQELDLFACIRPVKSFAGLPSKFGNVDLVIVRENTEGLYGGKEIEVSKGSVVSFKIVTEGASFRIAEQAFKYALANNRKQICIGHKANILKLGDGLFLRSAQKVAADYPQIPCSDSIIDALCMKLVMNPSKFDVIILENLYGDIVSDLCAGLVGGLGLVPGVNIGTDCAIFEACHGSAPDIAGQNKANPAALMLSAVLLLEHLGLQPQAHAAQKAIENTIAQEKYRTWDLGGSAGTQEFTKAVISHI